MSILRFLQRTVWNQASTNDAPLGDCTKKKMFTLKTCMIMSRSKLDYRTWTIAAYLIVTNLKGISSMKLHRDQSPGKPALNIWTDIPRIANTARERMGYPTQKPLALYERIIKASSNPGDIVFDPFCGCATTLVASEKLDRKWAGADIWNKAHEIVIARLRDMVRMFGDVHYTTAPPKRTDDGSEAAPFLQVKVRVKEPEPIIFIRELGN